MGLYFSIVIRNEKPLSVSHDYDFLIVLVLDVHFQCSNLYLFVAEWVVLLIYLRTKCWIKNIIRSRHQANSPFCKLESECLCLLLYLKFCVPKSFKNSARALKNAFIPLPLEQDYGIGQGNFSFIAVMV